MHSLDGIARFPTLEKQHELLKPLFQILASHLVISNPPFISKEREIW